ncbi:MAG TPA: hypothetical protein VMR81_05385, partial [Patescibacteria group bacterium]|nr:hypothetical protein [Patescibacteria group bacterium]
MKKSVLLILLLTLLAIFVFPTNAYASDLTIDFSQVIGPAERHATGFEWIFPMNAAVYPFISQLKPNIIKDPWGNEQTAVGLGAHKIQWLVGNGAVFKNGQGTHWYPWQESTAWQQWVTSIVSTYPPTSVPHEWIIWQEPNQNSLPFHNPDVWSGTDQQFFETWKIAVQTIRSLRPNDLIVGPSPSFFDQPYLQSFLGYAKTNNVLPDVLSWHETMNIGDNPAFNIYGYTPDLIPAHVNTIKQFMAANAIISVNKFDITEYQGSGDNLRPGPTVAFIADIERAGAEGTKGSWTDANQLEGLVTDPTNPQPRSIWWVYKRYADMTGNLVLTTYATSINGLGSYDASTQTAMVLMGNQGGAGAKTVQFNSIPSALISNDRVAVTLEQIPDTELSPLAAPIVISQSDQIVNGGVLSISIPSFGAWDAYVITLKKPAATVNPIKSAILSDTAVTVTFDTANASANDWIGVYKTGAADTGFLSWKWINDAAGTAPTTLTTNGKATLPVPNTTDTYEVRYFVKGGYQLMGSEAVTTGSSVKPGDLNGDGKVDIFDYNLLVANFG